MTQFTVRNSLHGCYTGLGPLVGAYLFSDGDEAGTPGGSDVEIPVDPGDE